MSTATQFEQMGTSALYETRVTGSVGWAAYVLPDQPLPPTITVSDSLTARDGHYVFAGSTPSLAVSDPAGFAAQALAYFAQHAGMNRGLVWLDGGSFDDDFPSYGFQFGSDFYGDYTARSNLNVTLGGNVNFFVHQGVGLVTEDDALCLQIAVGGTPNIGFQRGATDLGISIVDGSYQRARIPVSGPSTGAMVFRATMKPSTTLSSKGVNAGFEYHFGAGAGTTSVFYPAFDDGSLPASVPCIGTLDPGDCVNGAMASDDLLAGHIRTGFAFGAATPLASTFTTSLGRSVSLVPTGAPKNATAPPPGAGGLAFASDSDAGTARPDRTVYLSPAGAYALAPDSVAPGAEQMLVCGLFGSEHVTFDSYDATAGHNDTLTFLPSQPAFAPRYPYPAATLEEPDSGDVKTRLDFTRTTSWATMIAGASAPSYSAQPEGTPLYGLPGGSSPAGATVVLTSQPPEMPLPQGPSHAFPLVPYSGTPRALRGAVDAAAITQLESQVIAPERKAIVSAGAEETWAARAAHRLAMTDTPPTYTATPQGFVVQLDPATGAYRNVQLAQSLNGSTVVPFAFDNPTIEVQDALQTNQLFLVAVNDALFDDDPPGSGAHFADQLFVADWTMLAPVGKGSSPTDYRNVMILKFCDGALADRVKNPNRWTDPGNFSLLPGTDAATASLAYTGLSQWLSDYISAAIALAEGGSTFYTEFEQIVSDPDWNGVLVLRSDLSADDLPAEIRGIAPGIDFSRFYAHHFGFTVSQVKVEGDGGSNQTISVDGMSSIFGLIDYQDPAYEQNVAAGLDPDTPVNVPASGDFAFTVLQLRSRFENSKLVQFESRIQLTVDRLFGSRATSAFAGGGALPATALVLDGSYVDQGGKSSYVFQTTRTTVLTLDSNVLDAVAFSRVQFNTIDAHAPGGTVTSRFLVWGAFDFATLDDSTGALFDVLSFGSPAGTAAAGLGTGLAFSNLAVDMSFAEASPNAATFSVDTGNLAFDLDASTPRAAGLFKGFGLQLSSFVSESSGKTPADHGFLPVATSLQLDELGKTWFGVVYDVTLGGPGALASAAGFTSTLLLAWSPSSVATATEASLFVGLSLPGAAPGASLFSLQGVLKVAVGSIELLRQPVPGSAAGDYFYCLRLTDIGLKVFGVAKLPPDANISFFLFGDPNSTGSLGWYAAWVADKKSSAAALPEPRAQDSALPGRRG